MVEKECHREIGMPKQHFIKLKEIFPQLNSKTKIMKVDNMDCVDIAIQDESFSFEMMIFLSDYHHVKRKRGFNEYMRRVKNTILNRPPDVEGSGFERGDYEPKANVERVDIVRHTLQFDRLSWVSLLCGYHPATDTLYVNKLSAPF